MSAHDVDVLFETDLVCVRRTQDGGRAMYTKVNVSAGCVVFEEQPFLVVRSIHAGGSLNSFADIAHALDALEPPDAADLRLQAHMHWLAAAQPQQRVDHDVLCTDITNPVFNSTVWEVVRRALAAVAAGELDDDWHTHMCSECKIARARLPLPDSLLAALGEHEPSVARQLQIESMYRVVVANLMTAQSQFGVVKSSFSALARWGSAADHSCCPTVDHGWEGSKLVFVARRGLAAGTLVTFDYKKVGEYPRHVRRALLGDVFDCACERCDGRAVEPDVPIDAVRSVVSMHDEVAGLYPRAGSVSVAAESCCEPGRAESARDAFLRVSLAAAQPERAPPQIALDMGFITLECAAAAAYLDSLDGQPADGRCVCPPLHADARGMVSAVVKYATERLARSHPAVTPLEHAHLLLLQTLLAMSTPLPADAELAARFADSCAAKLESAAVLVRPRLLLLAFANVWRYYKDALCAMATHSERLDSVLCAIMGRERAPT